jgi:hypothetical protein
MQAIPQRVSLHFSFSALIGSDGIGHGLLIFNQGQIPVFIMEGLLLYIFPALAPREQI